MLWGGPVIYSIRLSPTIRAGMLSNGWTMMFSPMIKSRIIPYDAITVKAAALLASLPRVGSTDKVRFSCLAIKMCSD